jgi:hypothetical protein
MGYKAALKVWRGDAPSDSRPAWIPPPSAPGTPQRKTAS